MSVESQVAVLAQSVEQQSEVITRLDQNLTKLTDVASNVNKILAVHDEKLSQHEKNIKKEEGEKQKSTQKQRSQIQFPYDFVRRDY